ncbi:MAG: hypothetical protein Q7J67_00995 [bacterium]|nr:hypothetical protein [bacterium]
MKTQGLLDVIKEINNLKTKKIIKDYAIGGGIAKSYYLEPQFTYDLDLFILIDSMDDFHNVYDHFRREKCKIENVFITIKGVPVQFLPSFIHPLIQEAIKNSKKIYVDKIRTKVLTVEYLIATLLISFRQKDKYTIVQLLPSANMDLLKRVLKQFTNKEYPILERFKEITEKK